MAGDEALVITSLAVISGYISAEREELKIKESARGLSCALISLILHASYVSYIFAARQASGQERDSFASAEPIIISLIGKHPESGCFADWLVLIS